MAVTRTTSPPSRYRNVFLAGIVIGVVVTLILSALSSSGGVSKDDISKINDRLGAIEQKLVTPTPAPVSFASPAPGAQTISVINKDPKGAIGQTVELTGKVSNAHQGVGFTVVDADGSFLWVHTHDKLPATTATVKGTVTELKDQLAQWKNETGWPADDSALTTKLRNEKIFVEGTSVS